MEVTNVSTSAGYAVGNDSSAAPANLSSVNCLIYRFIIHCVIAAIICLIGFVTNTVSLFVLSKDKQSAVSAFLLQALAVADNSFLVIWFLHYPLKYVFRYAGTEADVHVSWMTSVRFYTYPVLYAAQTATIWLTVLVAVTRYVAICMPYKAAQVVTLQKAQFSVAAVAIFSILYNLPRYFEGTLNRVNRNGTVHYVYNDTVMGDSDIYKLVYFDVLYYIFSFVMPLLLLAVLNTRLTLAYRVIQARRARMKMRTDQDNNITLVMIIVVLVFMLCQAPARIVQIVWKYNFPSCDHIVFFLIELSNVLEVLNSSANFFIYCALRKQFRSILWKMFCGDTMAVPEQKPLIMNNHKPRISNAETQQPTEATNFTEETAC